MENNKHAYLKIITSLIGIIILLLIYIDVKPPNNDNQSSVAFTFQVANVCGAR